MSDIHYYLHDDGDMMYMIGNSKDYPTVDDFLTKIRQIDKDLGHKDQGWSESDVEDRWIRWEPLSPESPDGTRIFVAASPGTKGAFKAWFLDVAP